MRSGVRARTCYIAPIKTSLPARGYFQSVTCTDGLKWPMCTPDPFNIAWIARGVEMNRVNSAAAGTTPCSGSVSVAHAPSACNPGPLSTTNRPFAMSAETANDAASATPLLRFASSSAAAWL